MSYLEDNTLLIRKECITHRAFKRFRKISVGIDGDYAANSPWVNGTVLVPAGFPETRRKIEQAGYPTIYSKISQ